MSIVKKSFHRIVVITLAVLMALSTILAALNHPLFISAASNVNMWELADGGFESGAFLSTSKRGYDGWWIPRASSAEIKHDYQNAYSGEYYCRIMNNYNSAYQTINLEKGVEYTISAMCKAETDGTVVSVVFDDANDALAEKKKFQEGIKASEGWKLISYTYTPQVTGIHSFTVSGSAGICWDDFQITRENLLFDGDFEKGMSIKNGEDFAGWFVRDDGSRGFLNDPEVAYEGNVSFRALYAWNAIFQHVKLKKETTYTLKFYHKSPNSSYVKVGFLNLDNNKETIIADGSTNITPNSTEWQESTLTFTLPDTAAYRVNIMSSGNEFYLDNVSLTENKDPNIVHDGSFESNKFLTSEGTSGWYTSSTQAAFSTDKSVDKEYSMAFNADNAEISTLVSVTPNTLYKVSMQHIGAKDTSATIKILTTDGKELFSATGVNTGEDWVETVGRYVNTTYETLKLFVSAKAGVYVDLVSMLEPDDANPAYTEFGSAIMTVSDSGTNLIKNSGFETADGASWNTSDFLFHGLTVEKTADAFEGEYALQLKINGDDMKKGIFWIDVKPDTEYVFSISLRGSYLSDENAGNMYVALVDPKTNKTFATNLVQVSGITPTSYDNEWHTRTVAFNTGRAFSVGIQISAKSADVLMDNMLLCEKTDAVAVVDPMKGEQMLLTDTQNKLGSCEAKDNLILDSTVSGNSTDFWQTGVAYGDTVTVGKDKKDSSNGVLNYAGGKTPRWSTYMKWISVEKDTDYVLAYRVRGTKEGEASVSLLCRSSAVYRFADITPEYTGKWEYNVVSFNSGALDEVAFGICDGGGVLEIDDIVLCKAEAIQLSEPPYQPDDVSSSGDKETSSGDPSVATGVNSISYFIFVLALISIVVVFFIRKKGLLHK